MLPSFKHIFSGNTVNIRIKIIGIYIFLLAANIFSWVWAFIAFRHQPVFLGTALLAYGFGLRHALDADHIAAIDNVTRKLMQDNRRPAAVGLFFSVGHSLVLVIGVLAIAFSEATLRSRFNAFVEYKGNLGTIVSTAFLLIIAVMNFLIALSVYRMFRHVCNGGPYAGEDFDLLFNKRGFLARFFRPMFRLVKSSWHMVPLGFLFGLGFDTVTEVSLLGIAATEVVKGMSPSSIMVFPVLFAAGMSFVDTTDGVAMLGAYGWAYVNPVRKLYYNLTITLMSVAVALVVGGIEGLGLIGGEFSLTGWFWDRISMLNKHFGYLGYAIIFVFLFSWFVSYAVYRINRYDQLEINEQV